MPSGPTPACRPEFTQHAILGPRLVRVRDGRDVAAGFREHPALCRRHAFEGTRFAPQRLDNVNDLLGNGMGGFPREPAELQRLPGVGPYTAAAIACFAFGAQVAAPDTNAKRVLERAFGDPNLAPRPGQAYEWNQALFDLGREVCIARRPRCGLCPLAAECPSRGRTYAPLRKQSRFEGSFRQRRAELLRAIAAAGSLPDAEADAEALVSLVRDGLAEVSGGYARLPA